MRDPHRVLVDGADRIDNRGQMRALAKGGYTGPFSFEPFADSVSDLPDIRAALADSMAFVAQALQA
jgi:2-keto-myo-inositol isomerase